MKGVHATEVITFHSDNLTAENTLDEPTKIIPRTSSHTLETPAQKVTVPAHTFNVYKIKK